ncbi:hypothetical protein [Nocardia camponoti]|uniref:YcxB-like protein domain-containing protein n=1 Tax=Nocardia camponoti TaxID=1616106 RepID=A0A917QDR0_9NOCA|nr:hypothetical protein [Nocardia camponoti]GGK45495.1 hypothetical protein GCM10011591_16330 [Nocardia camponoti]
MTVAVALLSTEASVIGWMAAGAKGVAIGLFGIALMSGLAYLYVTFPPPRVHKALRPHTFPGARFAANFASDAVTVETATSICCYPYANLTRITTHDAMTLLYLGRAPMVFPQELFPPEMQQALRDKGIQVTP